jgi:hypothetical protein
MIFADRPAKKEETKTFAFAVVVVLGPVLAVACSLPPSPKTVISAGAVRVSANCAAEKPASLPKPSPATTLLVFAFVCPLTH